MIDPRTELLAAACHVVNCWESGDLAAAVNRLDAAAKAVTDDTYSIACAKVRAIAGRHREVMVLLSKGYNDRLIAEMLDVSIPTIHKARHEVYEALEIDSTAQLAVLVYRAGMLGNGSL
jgi:DNA-binding NarL/FixJ family response regulator